MQVCRCKIDKTSEIDILMCKSDTHSYIDGHSLHRYLYSGLDTDDPSTSGLKKSEEEKYIVFLVPEWK